MAVIQNAQDEQILSYGQRVVTKSAGIDSVGRREVCIHSLRVDMDDRYKLDQVSSTTMETSNSHCFNDDSFS
jgi:hypothetical protein